MTPLKQLYRLKDKEKKNYKKLNKIHKENYCLHCGYLGGDSEEQREQLMTGVHPECFEEMFIGEGE